jgi:hypothetical protein
MGLKGFEPLTLRLSSACSNQLSYRPGAARSAADENSERGSVIGQETVNRQLFNLIEFMMLVMDFMMSPGASAS